ncbi:9964_t:CDS:2 [Diversispora eburnea]|uniref:non-specific serine/threonine protein kinase n=1 Tax=Diversispora eburnea TaxID=1213867 RepID=A0A9N8WNE8_9GLOM|nr:9964_t:CDS:2 [Diversispora eburnea]
MSIPSVEENKVFGSAFLKSTLKKLMGLKLEPAEIIVELVKEISGEVQGLETETEKGFFVKSNEKILQEYFINECKPLQTSEKSKLVIEDVHSIPLLTTRKPNFVFIAKGCPLDALHVVAVGEIKKPNNQFSNADIGQAVSFGEKYEYVSPEKIHYEAKGTTQVVRPINTDRTSIVYEGKLTNMDSVVSSWYESKNLQKEDIGNIIETLRTAHSRNIVHMDLRRYNFIRDDDEKILIIDWGYSVSKNESGKFAGTLECVPLKSLINCEQITYSPNIDLICLVRSFYLLLHSPVNAVMERIIFDGKTDFESQAKMY